MPNNTVNVVKFGIAYRAGIAFLAAKAQKGNRVATAKLENLLDMPVRIGPHTQYGTFYTSGTSYEEGELMPCGHECGDCYC